MFARRGTAISSKIPLHFALLVLVALVLLGLFLAVGRGIGAPPTPPPSLLPSLIFSTATPVSETQCANCHSKPGDFKNDRLIFKHAEHIKYDCSACHPEFPHSQTGLKKPRMDLCFACHGMNHGVQGTLAKGNCEACHPPTAPRVPSDHTVSWKTSEHKSVSAEQLRNCQMCHASNFCEACHAANGVKSRPISTYIFEPVLPALAQPGVSFSVNQVVSMSQCAFCHPNIDGFKNASLIFNHNVHLVRSISCDRCHTLFPHRRGRTEKPPMQLCYGCHGIVHNGVKVATDACGACHPQGTNLVPNAHSDEFKTKSHPDSAKKNLANCEMCHQPSFCANCHTSKQIIAKDHGMGKYENKEVRGKWRKVHGKEATAKENCWVCHNKQYCDNCHKTDVPHAVTWLGTHGKLSKGQGRECNKCHQTKTTCQECHHGKVKSAKLTKENCTNCHELYANDFKVIINQAQQYKAARGGQLTPEESRFYRGYSVHAAHFEMTNTTPFVCERCHGETIKQGAGNYQFRTLCARCHGAYANGKLIAKFDIPELCFRCHQEKRGMLPP
ncbi:MAG: cytochrome c3 family protein [Actinobacteria bacterium]|nr:cytochrome c3 family protein [Actinomycetota bacterium]